MTGRISAALSGGPIVLDAAMGTRLIARGLDLRADDPALWNLSRPDDVLDVHRRDVAAGAGGLVTNTFGANRAWLSRLGRSDVAQINRAAVELARSAIGPDGLVLGSIGPTASDDAIASRDQAEALALAGVDAFLLETHTFDQALNHLHALVPMAIPMIVSLWDWPDPLDDAARRLADAGAMVLGANCLDGMGPSLAVATRLASATSLPLLIKPSAGRPGGASATPGSFAEAVPALLRLGVRWIGGCCGTTEAHVAAIASAARSSAMRGAPGG